MSQTKDAFNISDFAKDLLVQMRFGNDEQVRALNIGQVTTPHRGSSLAETLNKILNVSLQSSKQYVSDLQRNSSRIIDINDQFRLHAEKIQIVSFFETQPTSIGIKKTIVVERDSAILDYPTEISAPLNADHHNVCKYSSRQDANYTSVRNVLKSLVDKFSAAKFNRRRSVDKESSRSLQGWEEIIARLGVAPRPEDTLDALMESGVSGSCDWFMADEAFQGFMADERSQSLVLNVTGPPGCGKSVLASFLIQHLEGMGLPIQYWFFRHDEYRATRQCLLSIAFQMTVSSLEYSGRLQALGNDIDSIARSDLRSLWQKLFLHPLGKLGTSNPTPLYWVIDAVDECESAQAFFSLLGSLKGVRYPLRIILFSRSQSTAKPFDKLKVSLPMGSVTQTLAISPQDSLRQSISQDLDFTSWPDDLKITITESLLGRCQGNFLWLSLVIKELICCDTAEELERVLQETPWELLELYERIEKAILRDLKPSDSALVQAILSWVTCSERQLNERELKEALKPEYSILNLKHTISRLCGDFVVIDKRGIISMVHQTAKEYLTRRSSKNPSVLSIYPGQANTFIFDKLLTGLTDPRFRLRLKTEGCVGLLRYSCLSWSYHMAHCDEAGQTYDHVYKLATFFKSSACLSWIAAVAASGHLQVLVSTAKGLTTYLKRVHILHQDENPLAKPLVEIELLNCWSTELVKIVGKFGIHLLQYPDSIHHLVPLFCPPESAIGKQFQASDPLAPRVTGILTTGGGWDDCLAKFTVEQGRRPKAVLCLDSSFGIVTSDKSVNLYSSTTFQERGKFRHEETIVAAQFNQDGTLLVTCGIRSIKVWDTSTPTSQAVQVFSNPQGVRAMAVTFSRDFYEIFVCCIDSKVWRQLLSEPEEWTQVSWQARDQPGSLRGRSGGSTPICATFSPDGSKIVMAYRTAPIAVWGTESGNLIGRPDSRHGGQNVDYPSRLTWNPVTEHVIGVFSGGNIFKWYPLDQTYDAMETNVMATEIACSPDGRLIVTSQRDGSLKIFSFENFALIYNLTCMSRATALAFSPDGRRIYDIRQSFCSVWEPNALIRMAEQDEIDRTSDSASSSYDPSVLDSVVSEAATTMLEPVSALCVNAKSNAFAFGNEGGTVSYIPPSDVYQGQEHELVTMPCGIMGITCLTMNEDGTFMASASIDRKITVRKILEDGKIQSESLFETKMDKPITQLLFDAKGTHITIRCREAVSVWSLATKSPTMICSTNENDNRSKWIAHPFEPNSFISISPSFLTMYSSHSPSPSRQWPLDTTKMDASSIPNTTPPLTRRRASDWQKSSGDLESMIDHVLVAPDRSQILVQMSKPNTQPSQDRRITFMLLNTHRLSTSDIAHEPIMAQPLPEAILSVMQIPLGFVLGDTDVRRGSHSVGLTASARIVSSPQPGQQKLHSLAFIDRDFWVRTWSPGLDAGGTATRRHFFLPRDWINMECLELAQVTLDGRFLCPRNGEVAVVHNGLRGLDWVDFGV
ncbi:hypothetical protein N0V93_001204 [Gnomoniopsis smithogilvyi]|uniref:NACHT domain-containing protein n=1 Tax=Gnomoniopsis smithogilvyi TaxID=1191159 RepID=A0A9W9D2E5_9PEZI|nr:hypothetical protein N0V93_001204 [Gnomoniopsis smithogilvyi]